MPEMPEVETTRKDLERHVRGGKLSKIELGMTGQFRVTAAEDAEVEDSSTRLEQKHLRFACTVTTKKNTYRLEYYDQRRFGYMLLVRKNALSNADWYSELGIEPLSKAFTGDYLIQRAGTRKTDLKTLLTDQGVVAGIGNAYVCEALWTAKIKPDRPARTITDKESRAVVKAIKDVLTDAIETGNALLGTEKATAGRDGYFEYEYKVYGQEGAPCPRSDGGKVERATSKGRSSFLCPVCQK